MTVKNLPIINQVASSSYLVSLDLGRRMANPRIKEDQYQLHWDMFFRIAHHCGISVVISS